MLQTTWIALVLGFWSSLYLLDVFLKVLLLKQVHILIVNDSSSIFNFKEEDLDP